MTSDVNLQIMLRLFGSSQKQKMAIVFEAKTANLAICILQSYKQFFHFVFKVLN